MPFNHKEMTEAECIAIINMIRPGDVILSHTKGELSNVFLEKWGHGMIYSLSGLYEAVTAGVKETDLMFSLSRKDEVIVLRPKKELKEQMDMKRLDAWCKYAVGSLYDYNFETSAEAIYCFEMVADSLIVAVKGHVGDPCPEIVCMKKTPLGQQYLGSSFLNDNFEIVWQR